MNLEIISLLFLGIVFVYAILVLFITRWYSKSGVTAAHENYPKAIKHVSQSFIAIIVFLLMFYLAIVGLLPKDVLITLVSVFATAGFLSLNAK